MPVLVNIKQPCVIDVPICLWPMVTESRMHDSLLTNSLCCRFQILLGQRQGGQNHSGGEAQVLRGMSTGSQPFVRDLLTKAVPHLAFVTGSKDIKFVRLAKHLTDCVNLNTLDAQSVGTSESDLHKLRQSSVKTNFVGSTAHAYTASFFEVGDCGHAMHVERPEALLQILMLLLSNLSREA